MARHYRSYTDEQLKQYAAEVTSLGQLLDKVGLQMAGGNYANMKRQLQRLAIDCSHWKGHAWNKHQRLKDWSKYTRARYIKKHLIRDRGNKCERCGLSEWQSEQIALEIDHVDGDRTNNDPSNLKLNCPNCHSLTPTWRGRKMKYSKIAIISTELSDFAKYINVYKNDLTLSQSQEMLFQSNDPDLRKFASEKILDGLKKLIADPAFGPDFPTNKLFN